MPSFQGFLFDIDGVLEYQGRVYPGAVETLLALRGRGMALRFLTNSTLKSRASCAEKLRHQGFEVEEGEVITASYAAACYLREQGARSIHLMLAREGVDEFAGFARDDERPEYVVVGDYRSGFNFENLNHALRLLAGGAKLVGMQNELTDGSMGSHELNVGAWVEMLSRASGVQAVYIGKPYPYAFSLALRSLGLPRQAVLMVGDRVQSDIRGARDAGLRCALLRTGEFRPQDLQGEVQPDVVLDDIRQLIPWLDGA